MKKFIAVLTLVATAGTLVACGEENTAGGNAVAIGGTFEFVSPGGQTSISYPPEDREKIGNINGVNLITDEEMSLDEFDGQVVVLNSWGQWCGPCRSESDDLQRVHERMQQTGKGTLLGINVKDFSRAKAQNFVKDNGITYPSLYDPPFKSALALGGVPTSVIPTTIVLDKQHRPAHIFLQEVTEDQLWDVVEPILNEDA
ncbi:TlpA family protein disulfide reductase [Corynebacterium sp. ED61]|uniref:TlpA disulfide reductase family protein n=1 Tax=uncultured Corynebacterium sp. TaxID=159447 RepID=UPI0018846340|nr:TlpA disulfide reductase family protein [Corynebacterium dentalis]MBF0581523.1 TlpA family protein disulfide reductase [Corynebacterium sp. ED61]